MEILEIIIAIFSLLATAYIGFIGYRLTKTFSTKTEKLSHQSLFHQLFRDFNSRYGQVNSSLVRLKNQSLNSNYTLQDLKADFELYDKIIDYLNICAEEFYWYKEGRLDEKVWTSWQMGMNLWYQELPILKELWFEEINGEGYKSYYLKQGENFFKESNHQS